MGKNLTDHKSVLHLTKLEKCDVKFFEGIERAVLKHAQVYLVAPY